MILGGQQVTLKPLTTGEFLELIYLASDVLHEALVGWVEGGEDAYSFVSSLMSELPKEKALEVIFIFLHTTPRWMEENNVSADEAYKVLKEAVGLNDWSEILQAMIILDTIKVDEVMDMLSLLKKEVGNA